MTSSNLRITNLSRVSLAMFAIAIFSAAPRAHADHNFTVKGVFTCTSKGVTLPIEGAIVAVMRDKRWAADPIETEVQTGPDGSFSAQWHSKDVDTYYAKLFLNDKQGVFLRDWWTLDVREFNSVERGTSDNAVIDLGVTDISRDDGKGTPRCAVWQGGRHAWQEFLQATGQRPLIGENGNYQIVMESTDSGIVWTSRDTTHWEVGYRTDDSGFTGISNPLTLTESDLFSAYGVNIHEFGHALRHTADGSDNHFNWDATRFLYAHSHELCMSYPAGYSWNDGYGFNEGWADYWEGTDLNWLDGCLSTIKPTDFSQESAVARDLEALEQSLVNCAGVPPSLQGDARKRQQRSLMFAVLAGAGHEAIHSENDFRAAFAARFPNCATPLAGTFPSPVSPATIGSHRIAELRAPSKLLQQRIASLSAARMAFPKQITAAELASKRIALRAPLSERKAALVRPALLRAQQAATALLQERLQDARRKPLAAKVLMTAEGAAQRKQQVSAFDQQARAITIQALTAQRAALQADNAQLHADDIQELGMQIDRVRAGTLSTAGVFPQEGDDDLVKAKK